MPNYRDHEVMPALSQRRVIICTSHGCKSISVNEEKGDYWTFVAGFEAPLVRAGYYCSGYKAAVLSVWETECEETPSQVTELDWPHDTQVNYITQTTFGTSSSL